MVVGNQPSQGVVHSQCCREVNGVESAQRVLWNFGRDAEHSTRHTDDVHQSQHTSRPQCALRTLWSECTVDLCHEQFARDQLRARTRGAWFLEKSRERVAFCFVHRKFHSGGRIEVVPRHRSGSRI